MLWVYLWVWRGQEAVEEEKRRGAEAVALEQSRGAEAVEEARARAAEEAEEGAQEQMEDLADALGELVEQERARGGPRRRAALRRVQEVEAQVGRECIEEL